ncbi:uncharacterized protein LOC141630912 [Silene latifolia]|uniref:uncharacterized protein LOC141630912 n=1 Tax=Silene latifolia TaxID=37657 RepID=UPI003D781D59
MCKTGNRDYETLEHLFSDCEVSVRIWFDSALGIRTNQNSSLGIGDWIINWITYLKDREHSINCITQFLAILNSIWTRRNNSIFRGEGFIPKVFFKQLDSLASLAMKEPKNSEWVLAYFQNGSQGSQEIDNEVKRIKDGHPVFLIGSFGSCSRMGVMVDASWKVSGFAAFGWAVFRDVGGPLFEGKMKGRAESPLQAEAIGVLKVLEWAKDQGFLHMEVSSDCLSLLQQWARKESKHHHTKGIMGEISSISASFHYLCFSFIHRNLNRRAHTLQKRAMREH